METADKLLDIVQKIVVITAALVAGWYVLVRQDHSSHATLTVTSKIHDDCTLAARIQVKNPKGIIIEPVSFSIQAYKLDYREIVDAPDNQLRISEQVMTVENAAKIGETFARVLSLKLPEGITSENAIMLRGQMTLVDSTIYNEETIVEVPQCDF